MGILKNFLHSLLIAIPLLFFIAVINVFEADMFSTIFSPLGLIVIGLVWFAEVSLMRL